jgi:hypothetical protein
LIPLAIARSAGYFVGNHQIALIEFAQLECRITE